MLISTLPTSHFSSLKHNNRSAYTPIKESLSFCGESIQITPYDGNIQTNLQKLAKELSSLKGYSISDEEKSVLAEKFAEKLFRAYPGNNSVK